MEGKKAVLFFDVDLTLTDGATHEVPQSAQDAIHAAQKNGHLCFVNTGRPYSHVDPPVKAVGFDGYVCGCGIEIVLRGPDGALRKIQDVKPSVEVQHRIRDLARELGQSCVFEGEGGIWYDGAIPLDEASMNEHMRLMRMGLYGSDNVYEPNFAYSKFLADDVKTPEALAFLKEVDRYFDRIDRGGFFECVPKGYTKGTGLDTVMRLLGENRVSYVFGDSPNDLEMFAHGDISVAMGNAFDSVKAKADYVTDDLHADGVANAIRHFGLA